MLRASFSFWGRTEKGYEMLLELVSGADFRCVLHDFSIWACLKGSWGKVWAESGRKSTGTKTYILVSLVERHSANPGVLKNIFRFYLGSPSPRGSRERVRTVMFLRRSKFLG